MMDARETQGLILDRVNGWLGWAIIMLATAGITATIFIPQG